MYDIRGPKCIFDAVWQKYTYNFPNALVNPITMIETLICKSVHIESSVLSDIGQNAYLPIHVVTKSRVSLPPILAQIGLDAVPNWVASFLLLGAQVMSARTWTGTPECIPLKKILQCAARSAQQIIKLYLNANDLPQDG